MFAPQLTATLAFHDFLNFAAAKSTKTTTSGSATFFLIIVVVLLGVVFWTRSRRKGMMTQQTQQREVSLGDEILTTSGIYGRVMGFQGERVEVEIAPNTTIVIARHGIARRVDPSEHPTESGYPPPSFPDSSAWPSSESTFGESGGDHGHSDGGESGGTS